MPGLGGFRLVRDEGSSSPFMARIFIGLYGLRDDALMLFTPGAEQEVVRTKFDEGVQPLVLAAEAARDAALEIVDLIAEHVGDVNSGNALDVIGEQINITRTVDRQLGQSVDKLLHQSIVATKTCLQRLLKDPLGVDIGFLFATESAFEHGISQLEASGDSELAELLPSFARPNAATRSELVHENGC